MVFSACASVTPAHFSPLYGDPKFCTLLSVTGAYLQKIPSYQMCTPLDSPPCDRFPGNSKKPTSGCMTGRGPIWGFHTYPEGPCSWAALPCCDIHKHIDPPFPIDSLTGSPVLSAKSTEGILDDVGPFEKQRPRGYQPGCVSLQD